MFEHIRKLLKWLEIHTNEEKGQTLIEYALIILLVALAVIIVLGLLGGGIEDIFQDIVNILAGAGGTT